MKQSQCPNESSQLLKFLETIESAFPDFKLRHERNAAIQASFTPEQIDFICFQIGEWYFDWKTKIVPDNCLHRLGIAKEELKEMICGK